MFEPNIARIEALLDERAIVLDIGGWAQPFRRADIVVDAFPYETRGTWYRGLGLSAATGSGPERFSKDTWIQRDICDREPLPFADKSIDFVICSHVLEDIRDPLYVCAEMIRVAKAGYIEVPSRLAESIYDSEWGCVGAPHHRWLVTIEGNSIVFEMKYHLLPKRGLHLPNYTVGLLSAERAIQYLFWNDRFNYSEADLALGEQEIERRLREYVVANAIARPVWYGLMWSLRRRLSRRAASRYLPAFVFKRALDLWRRMRQRVIKASQRGQ